MKIIYPQAIARTFTRTLALTFALALSQLIGPLALAGSETRLPLRDLFSPARGGGVTCFGREYSHDHLAAHPSQTVRSLRAKLVRDLTLPAEPNNYMELELGLTGEENFYRVYRAYLPCDLATGRCTMECDGGRVEAWGTRDGSLHLRNEGIVISGGCGESEEKPLVLNPTAGGDDLFRLSRLPADFCQL